jgi:hypothetical protein
MAMFSPSRAKLDDELRRLTPQTLAACWLTQAALAVVVRVALPIPERPLLIERGACATSQWQDLLQRYSALRLQDQLGRQRFRPVIQASVFGTRISDRMPSRERLEASPPVGAREPRRLRALRERYPSVLVLSCPLDSSSAPS